MEFYPCSRCQYSRLSLCPALSTAHCLLVAEDKVPHVCASRTVSDSSLVSEMKDVEPSNRISFAFLDYDLRLRFFQLCSPVLQNDLRKVSKYTSGLPQQRPRNFVAEEVVISRYKFPLDRGCDLPPSSVVESRKILKLENLASRDILQYKNSIKFNHSILKLVYSDLDLEDEFRFICNSRIKIAHVICSLKGIKMKTILDSMPNLKIFYFCPNQLEPDWCSQLLKWKQNFKLQLFSISLHDRSWITTLKPRLLFHFFSKQGKHFKMELHFSFVRKSETSRFDFYSHFEPSFDGERCQQLIVYYYKNIVHLKPKKI